MKRKPIQIPGAGKTKTVVLEPGRWTIQRPGESASEADTRLLRGEDIDSDKENLDPRVREMLDRANQTRPRFNS